MLSRSPRGLVGCAFSGRPGVPLAILLVILTAALLPREGENRPAAPPVATDATVVPTPEQAATGEPTPAATATPSALAPSRPADLIPATQRRVSQLVRERQLDAEAAKELDQRLDEVAQAHAAGEVEKAWNKLRETAEKIVKLREEKKLTSTGYEALKAALTQLAQALPRP